MQTPPPSVLDELASIVDQIMPTRDDGALNPSSSFVDDLRMERPALSELALAIEERFGVHVPQEALAGTVGDVVALVERELASD